MRPRASRHQYRGRHSAGVVAPAAVGAIKAAAAGFTLSLYLLGSALMLATVILITCFRPRSAHTMEPSLAETHRQGQVRCCPAQAGAHRIRA